MNRFLPVISLAALACIGCEKKEPKPVVALAVDGARSAPDPSFAERADAALRNISEKTLEPAPLKIPPPREEGRPHPLRSELEKHGRVVREKANGTTAPADNAQIVATVKSKLVADREIFASKIQVIADQGVVTLTGSVGSTELLSRAIQLALDTEGVNRVVSLLTIDA